MPDPETPATNPPEPEGATPEQVERMRPKTPPPIVKLNEVDGLKLENAALRLAMAGEAVEKAKRAYGEELRFQAQAFADIGERYEIDPTRYELDPINKELRLRAPTPVPQRPIIPPDARGGEE